MLRCFHIVLDRNRPAFWSFFVKDKSALSFQFFGAFLSNRVPTKDVNGLYVSLVTVGIVEIIPANSGNFEATTYYKRIEKIAIRRSFVN